MILYLGRFGTRAWNERPCLDQHAQALFEEQRIAAGPRYDLAERGRERLPPERERGELPHGLVRDRIELDPCLRFEPMKGFRPREPYHQERSRPRMRSERAERVHDGRIRPVQVVEQDDDRSFARQALQHGPGGIERIPGSRGSVATRGLVELEQQRQPTRHAAHIVTGRHASRERLDPPTAGGRWRSSERDAGELSDGGRERGQGRLLPVRAGSPGDRPARRDVAG